VIFRDFDSSFTRKNIIVTKERGYTVFRDQYTLKQLARSKLSIPKAIKSAFDVKPSSQQVTSFRTSNQRKTLSYINDVERRGITLKYQYTKISPVNLRGGNKVLRKTVAINKPIRKSGNIVVDVTFISEDGMKVRGQYRSRGGFLLDIKKEREAGIANAINNGMASGDIAFSPTSIILHNVWYEYRSDKFVEKAEPPRITIRGTLVQSSA